MSELSEFAENLGARLASARAELDRSRAAGDDYGVLVHSADVANLERLAERHDLPLDELSVDGLSLGGLSPDPAGGGGGVSTGS
jgi:hypothetical protein